MDYKNENIEKSLQASEYQRQLLGYRLAQANANCSNAQLVQLQQMMNVGTSLEYDSSKIPSNRQHQMEQMMNVGTRQHQMEQMMNWTPYLDEKKE